MDGGTVRLPRIVGQGKALEIALTGRKVSADECYTNRLCEKVVPHGETRIEAESMAHQIARFPQAAVRADRASIIETRRMPVREALRHEWANGMNAIVTEGIEGAKRFSAGAGRHGDFEKI